MAHDVKLGLWLTTNQMATTPTVSAVDTTATGYDLEEMQLVTPVGDPLTERVVETMRVRITGTSKADLRTKLSAVYDFADQVRRFWKGANPYFGRVLLQVEDTGNSYWSLLYDVQVSHDDILGATLANYQTVVTVTYERAGFWEKSSSIVLNAITLTNPNGTGITLNIANCNDGTGVSPNILANYVDIDTTDIDGDVPTPLYFGVTNKENVATGNSIIYVGGIGVSSAGVLPTLFFEGEAASGGTSTADATCSGSAKGRVVLASGAEAEMLAWSLTSNVDRYLGLWYKIVARFAAVAGLGDVSFRWKLTSGTTVIWEGPQFRLENPTTLIQELGEFPLPPLVGWAGTIYLRLYGEQTTGASITLDVDYIQLLSADIAVKLVGLVPQEYNVVVELPNEETIYPVPARAVSYYDWYALWNRVLMINPGQYYRLHFVVQSEVAGTAEKDRNSNVGMMYRQRYRSIGE